MVRIPAIRSPKGRKWHLLSIVGWKGNKPIFSKTKTFCYQTITNGKKRYFTENILEDRRGYSMDICELYMTKAERALKYIG